MEAVEGVRAKRKRNEARRGSEEWGGGGEGEREKR